MNYDEIKQLIDLFEQTDLTEMELTRDSVGLRLVRGGQQGNAGSVSAPVSSDVAPSVPSLSALEKIVASVQNGAGSSGVELLGNKASSGSGEESAAESEKGTVVKAPIVGTFYAAASPEQPPFVKVGDSISEGDTLCIIEAMKFMNEVPSEVSGTISEVLVRDGEFVEFGQPLFRII